MAAVQYELGLVLSETGDIEGAIAAFSRTLELEPARADAWRLLGDCLSEAGRTADAARAYAKHIELRLAERAQAQRSSSGTEG